ncbi:phosphoglycerate mutase [candidate division WOR-3 bacterium]|nr:phosphoglycerate mutase [candidate division WOR-3 bacterium]
MSDLTSKLARPSESRILLVVLDGLGGLPLDTRTELEKAHIPNLDRLAKESSLGALVPIEHGVTPGSGPAHIALFGYDPVEFEVARGVLECLGVRLDVKSGKDLCARANFANVKDGRATDRRAKDANGERMPTRLCEQLCAELQVAVSEIEDSKVVTHCGEEHRFAVMFRGPGFADGATDSDPGKDDLPVKQVGGPPGTEKTARVANEFIRRCIPALEDAAARGLKPREQSNYVLLRGLGVRPGQEKWPTLGERFKLKAACVAAYPMYRGLGELLGMNVRWDVGKEWDSGLAEVERASHDHTFVFLHLKDTDKAGEDGKFDAKVTLLERFDSEVLPRLTGLEPDVLCITGDHSTPAAMRGHSWHPVPVLLRSKYALAEGRTARFSERACLRGNLGVIYSKQLMGLLLAHAGKLDKFGA